MIITIKNDYGERVIEDAIAYKIWTPEDIESQAEEMEITLTDEQLNMACDIASRPLSYCTDTDWEFIKYAIKEAVNLKRR